jgi:hypothetical protein
VESGERGGQLLAPGPGLIDTDEQPALSAGDPGGDLQQPVAQLRGFGVGEVAVEESGLVQAIRSAAVRASSTQAALIANCREGSRSRPVFLAQRIRSSTRA